MTTQCRYCPLLRKDAFVRMSKEEIEFMQKFKAGELTVEPGTPILMQGSNAPQLFTVLSGLGIRDKMLENGQRQVINFVFPGDFIGLQAGVLGKMGHSIEARTHMRLCVFNRSEFWNFFKNHPSRAFDITWLAAIEEHFLGETLATLGQRTAVQAVAWALVRIYQRGETLGMVTNNQMELPYTQRDMADALGLSLVHTNKTLAKLKERQLASWSDRTLRISNLHALAEVAVTSLTEPPKRPLM
ncbi:cAMP-binding domain of CRP or a regulatory subunit of cAMP-dependent protein kinases [Sulfitobacter brevis]|uniref:cAMP-binding domain of CRP or a regulatory subunit of cAMP-dependent protein kinases n=1 Tax=Sulfitobacter brevis TaxID=74348 RepID=A0A1I1XXR0_9RHOB|nr:Crp/Fnr family transcriptional regulator [Sulfitobacter brevis]SFE11999.1 cAMP-binding domain of CRP or a regulatory subunit of cAMP-dependent protein kinases [Sulfitobacter brevis]